MTAYSTYLRKLKRKYLAIKSVELFLFCAAGCSLVFLITHLFYIPAPVGTLVSASSGVLLFWIFYFLLNLHKVREDHFISFINQKYPEAEQSADLLFMESDHMTPLQRLQREKVEEQFPDICASITLPNGIAKAFMYFLGSIIVSFSLYSLSDQRQYHPRIANDVLQDSSVTLPASVRQITINVAPPDYTRLPAYETHNPDLQIPAGSVVSWIIHFNDPVINPVLLFSSGDSLAMSGDTSRTFVKKISETALYQIAWENTAGRRRTSRYFKLEVMNDEPPKIIVHDESGYGELDPDEDPEIDIRASLSDDYALTTAYIIATVSKGTGESVKFREEKLPFASPRRILGRNVKAAAKINLSSLGLTPGDELYYYIEALDNRYPLPNRTRTETFFVSLRDTASTTFVLDDGVGADVMPDYFRSQRQIIIDSEKLLREKQIIQPVEFNRRSNELGYDQKMLRLKYGEFLGEEFESAIGPTHSHEADEQGDGAEEQNPLKEYTHQHDTDNEHNLIDEDKSRKHEQQTGRENSEDPAAAYRHVHDDPEEATFFTESIRAKLKAALTLMWDAELHLRLADPAKSLPYQYKALKLLKEISNASRIYVHKTGFDPPPLKEDKRLTGDLSEVKSSRHPISHDQPDPLPAVRYAFSLSEDILQRPASFLTKEELDAMLRAGQELAARSIDQPGKHLHALAAINSLDTQVSSDSIRKAMVLIRKAFWTALPKETVSPAKPGQGFHSLDRKFAEKLQSVNE